MSGVVDLKPYPRSTGKTEACQTWSVSSRLAATITGALGRARRRLPPSRDQADGPPASGRPDPRLRDAGAARRPGAIRAHILRRAGLTVRGGAARPCPLERHPVQALGSSRWIRGLTRSDLKRRGERRRGMPFTGALRIEKPAEDQGLISSESIIACSSANRWADVPAKSFVSTSTRTPPTSSTHMCQRWPGPWA